MNLRSTFIIYRKELTDVLRDRRTIISMVLFPLVLMPLLTIGIVTFMKSRIEKIMDQTSMIAWIAPAELDSVKERLAATPSMQLLAEVNDSATIIELIKDKTLDAAVIIPPVIAVIVQEVPDTVTPGSTPTLYFPCTVTSPPVTLFRLNCPVLSTVIDPLKSVVGVRISPPVVVVNRS